MTATVGAPARVDVWISPEGELTAVLLDAYRAWMSPDEARQSQRFLREEDRQRYLLTRGLARGVLAGYTGETPSALAFATQEFGKPVLLAAPGVEAPPHFNLSHTRGLVVLAVCREAEIGVDVESIDRSLDPLRLAARHFSPSEREALAATPDAQRHERFFELWTLKEAYAKALGQGLNLDLQSFSVELDAAQPRIVEHAADGGRSSSCQCRLHVPLAGYRLALVVRDSASEVDVRFALGLPLQRFAPIQQAPGPSDAPFLAMLVPIPSARLPMSRTIIHTDSAPRAIGPYSQAVKAGNTVYLSGQIPLDPATGELVGGDITAQTRRVFDNLVAVCAAAGGSLADVVRVGIYLTDLGDFAAVNAVMAEYCQQPYPARSTIQVSGLPKGARVEVDAVVVLGT